MHSWLGRPLLGGKDADEWKPSNWEEVASNIEQWYQAGRPLFPRESLQNIHDQLQKSPKNGDLIYVKGFDDVVYEYQVLTGNTRMLCDDADDADDADDNSSQRQVHYVMGKPHIRYSAVSHMKSRLDWSRSRSYCGLSIGHWMTRADEAPEQTGVLAANLEFFESNYLSWEQSPAWKQIRTTLSSLKLPSKITKIIGMACGSFSISSYQPKGCSRSAVQHNFLITVQKALREHDLAAEDVECYVQDPAYCEADRRVLQTFGIQVVDDPEGFLLMDEGSLVFSCAPNICVKEIVADIVRPPVLIWCKVEEDNPEYSSTDPNSPRVLKMIETCYDDLPFPEDENFTQMQIYTLKHTVASS
ncbi:hypothetical protein BDV59DRAFT_202199 [Aspergillus ambiguus]|uniref:SRR1 family protein n=1 Tax=Aspergillus ambiguus TaxID=176160 RepID=UPI003CCDFAB1